MNNAKYLLDTNIFVRFQKGEEYDKDCFPTHYNNFLKLLDDGIAISIDKVKDELDDEYFCVEYEDIFKESITNEITQTYNTLRVKIPDYFENVTIENPFDADQYILTYAYHHDLCIVTQDEYLSTSNINNTIKQYNIPTLCDMLGAISIDNKDKKENIGQYKGGFGCICLTELIRIEELMKD
ncbi:MAG: hypothetical protein BZ137_01330 [Methanosphaera sp. rholeuAM130]|nr:MAG: hypothetical protein BZ137_01330 [Methanosphaera sp. rholeuAM130]